MARLLILSALLTLAAPSSANQNGAACAVEEEDEAALLQSPRSAKSTDEESGMLQSSQSRAGHGSADVVAAQGERAASQTTCGKEGDSCDDRVSIIMHDTCCNGAGLVCMDGVCET